MKRLRGSNTWTYDSLMLFRDDLEELIHIFSADGSGMGVEISDVNVVYESLDELQREKGDRPPNLKFYSRDVGIVLVLESKKPSLLTLRVTDTADATFQRAHSLLYPKMRPLYKTLNTTGSIAFALSGTLLVQAIFEAYTGKKFAVGDFIVAVALLLTAGLSFTTMKSKSLFISLKRRHEVPSFFTRNKDAMAMHLISGLIGLVLGIAGTLIASYLKH